jgi:hypothetical protein
VSAPIESRPGLMADDIRRLRWLREDLTSCLVQIGSILRRTSGEAGLLPASRVTLEAPSTRGPDAEEIRDPLTELSLPVPLHPPVAITWTWADGAAVHYDWRDQTWRLLEAEG